MTTSTTHLGSTDSEGGSTSVSTSGVFSSTPSTRRRPGLKEFQSTSSAVTITDLVTAARNTSPIKNYPGVIVSTTSTTLPTSTFTSTEGSTVRGSVP